MHEVGLSLGATLLSDGRGVAVRREAARAAAERRVAADERRGEN